MAETVKDVRILNKVEQITGLRFDRRFRYCVSANIDCAEVNRQLAPLKLRLDYRDGCFYPFLVRI